MCARRRSNFLLPRCIDRRHRKQVCEDIGNTSALRLQGRSPMAWQPKDLMDIKREFMELAMQEGANRRELCRRFGIGAKAAYALLKRFANEGPAAYTPRSRRPLTSPTRTSSTMEQAVVALRQEHPAWGGRKIARRLVDLGHAQVPPASTITAILHRHGCALSMTCPMLCGKSTSKATLIWHSGVAIR